MNAAPNNPSGEIIQLGMFDSIMGLLSVNFIFLIGSLVVIAVLAVILKKDHTIPKMKTSVLSMLFYFYLCVLFSSIVGTPSLGEFMRLSQLGEKIFNPNVNLIPFSDGLTIGYVLNVFLFIPLGFLCPAVSRTFGRLKNTVLMGTALSLFIEISQLFTLCRATDIDDLTANIAGTAAGYFCFRLFVKLRIIKPYSDGKSEERDYTAYLVFIIMTAAIVLGFFR